MTRDNQNRMLPSTIMDDVDAFYGLPDDLFAKMVDQLTQKDPRLALLFYATRQRVQHGRSDLKDV